MVSIPVVKDVHLKKTMLGKYVAVHNCPHCKDRLKSREYEIGKPDECPICGGIFAVSKRILQEILHDRIRLKEEKLRERQRKKEAKAKSQHQLRPKQKEGSQKGAKKKRSDSYLEWGSVVFGTVVLYVLSVPFTYFVLTRLVEWFDWFEYRTAEALFVHGYYPLIALYLSSDTFRDFMDWYFDLFPRWFVNL